MRSRDGLCAGFFFLFSSWLAGCGGAEPATVPSPPSAPPTLEETKPVACMRRTVHDHVETLLFDGDGNLFQSEHRRGDGLGGMTRYHRAPTGELLAYEVTGDFNNASGTFIYGPHKELVGARLTASNKQYLDEAATLHWRGTFAATAGINRPFVGHGGAGGATLSDGMLLAANLKVRQPANPMPPISFTGRVTAIYVSGYNRRETYDYRDGRLQSWVGVDGAWSKYRWDEAENLIEEAWCRGKDRFTGEKGECQSATARVENGLIRSVTINGTSSLTRLSFDDQGRVTFGTSNASGSPTSDSAEWSDCPVPPTLPRQP